MINKTLVKYFLVLILFLSTDFIFAQVNSPYSRIGLGEPVFYFSARRVGMGLSGVATPDRDYINAYNPAALSFLNLTRFETGVEVGSEFQSYNGSKNFYGTAKFNGLSFGFPVSSVSGVGVEFGIVPVSKVNYNIEDHETSGDTVLENYTSTYTGKGGISKIFLGASYKLPFDVSIGATFDYYFGNIEYNSSLDFPDNQNLNVNYVNSFDSKGIGSTVGIISPNISKLFGSEKINDFRIGASASFSGKLSVDSTLTGTSAYTSDTISTGNLKIKMPYRLSVGASMSYNNNYLFSAEYLYQPWNKYLYNGLKSSNLRALTRYAIGFEYEPDQDMDKTFWEQIEYRAGLTFENTQYIINGSGLNQYSVNGGISLPLNKNSMLDIGLEYSMRGSSEANIIKENVFTFNIGLNLGELWFVRSDNQ